VRKTNKAHNTKLLLALTDDLLLEFKSIEDDILNLVDEVDLHEFLKEASEAIEDAAKLSEFIREKVTIAIERFLVSMLESIYVWIWSLGHFAYRVTRSITGLSTEDVHTGRKTRSR
jgi:hypothetical protein